MVHDTEPRSGTSGDVLAYHLARHSVSLDRIEVRLGAIEGKLSQRLTPEQIIKVAVGFGLPILVLLLTGNAEVARRFIGLF